MFARFVPLMMPFLGVSMAALRASTTSEVLRALKNFIYFDKDLGQLTDKIFLITAFTNGTCQC
jgi:hypothetical protein